MCCNELPTCFSQILTISDYVCSNIEIEAFNVNYCNGVLAHARTHKHRAIITFVSSNFHIKHVSAYVFVIARVRHYNGIFTVNNSHQPNRTHSFVSLKIFYDLIHYKFMTTWNGRNKLNTDEFCLYSLTLYTCSLFNNLHLTSNKICRSMLHFIKRFIPSNELVA